MFYGKKDRNPKKREKMEGNRKNCIEFLVHCNKCVVHYFELVDSFEIDQSIAMC